MERIDCVVVGAGVIGLAVARQLALAGHETLIVERASSFGTETSSRNSEVIHAGIYYPQGSLKARLCVQGRDLLYEYCERYAVAHRRCGKLIVANDESQLKDLERLRAGALQNGVTDLEWLDRADTLALEPALRCVASLHSGATGIVDSHAFMASMLAEARKAGASVAYRSPVARVVAEKDGFAIVLEGEAAPALATRILVNAGGLDAPSIASRIEGLAASHVPRAWYAKGSYFTLAGRAPFSRLIYPMPEAGGVGVHLTLDLAGQARFGPDVEWTDTRDYAVAPQRAERFYDAIRKYWPGLPDGALLPGYAGIRPKITGPGEPAVDFRIDGPQVHGLPGLVNLFGIESPGLTAALAIAVHVRDLLDEAGTT